MIWRMKKLSESTLEHAVSDILLNRWSHPHQVPDYDWHFMIVHEGFYNFSKVCLQFVIYLNVVFFRLFYDNITFQHLFIIIKCPAELNFDCKILIRSVPSTFVTELLLRGYIF